MAPPRAHRSYWERVDILIGLALAEDLPARDVTTDAVLDVDQRAVALFVAKEDLTVSGLAVAARVLETIDGAVRWTGLAEDGAAAAAGTELARAEGRASSLLAGERTALNFLQHLSGIATATRAVVGRVTGYPALVMDTRKTLPGWRLLEKEAVRDGGGTNHRFSLSDGVLIKDNHVALAGGVGPALRRARTNLPPGTRIEVEVSTVEEVGEALAAGADVILVDNATPETLAAAVAAVGGRVPVEASGGIHGGNIAEVARTGVAMISLGALTHSARAVDISMEIVGRG